MSLVAPSEFVSFGAHFCNTHTSRACGLHSRYIGGVSPSVRFPANAFIFVFLFLRARTRHASADVATVCCVPCIGCDLCCCEFTPSFRQIGRMGWIFRTLNHVCSGGIRQTNARLNALSHFYSVLLCFGTFHKPRQFIVTVSL